MTVIPSFGSSLLHAPQANATPSPSVEEILSKPSQYEQAVPQASDAAAPVKSHSMLAPVLVTLVGLAGVVLAGRKGWLGGAVKRLMGGGISGKKLQEKINQKLADYMSRTGDEAFSFSVLRNGNIRAERINRNGHKEIITFNKQTGAPETRTVFTKFGRDDKALEYKSFKGFDVLDADFNEADGLFKSYSRTGVRRKYLIFGPKQNVATIKNNDLSMDPVSILTSYTRKGKVKNQYITDLANTNSIKREYVYDKSGRLVGLDITEGNGPRVRVYPSA